jgi:hypothetical protein
MEGGEMSENIDGNEILNLPMLKNDAGATTIRAYLAALLTLVWQENEGFNGKRPFGNSGWDRELYAALINAKKIEGDIDEYGRPDHYDSREGDQFIYAAIDAIAATSVED